MKIIKISQAKHLKYLTTTGIDCEIRLSKAEEQKIFAKRNELNTLIQQNFTKLFQTIGYNFIHHFLHPISAEIVANRLNYHFYYVKQEVSNDNLYPLIIYNLTTLSHDLDQVKQYIFDANTGLVKNIAFKQFRKMKYQNTTIDDLINLGYEGLTEAFFKYDSSTKNAFSTFAVNWINQKVLSAYETDALINVPTYMKTDFNYKKLKNEGLDGFSQNKSHEGYKKAKEIANYIDRSSNFISLDAKINDKDFYNFNNLNTNDISLNYLLLNDLKKQIVQLLKSVLDDEEFLIFCYLFGFNYENINLKNKVYSIKQIATALSFHYNTNQIYNIKYNIYKKIKKNDEVFSKILDLLNSTNMLYDTWHLTKDASKLLKFNYNPYFKLEFNGNNEITCLTGLYNDIDNFNLTPLLNVLDFKVNLTNLNLLKLYYFNYQNQQAKLSECSNSLTKSIKDYYLNQKIKKERS